MSLPAGLYGGIDCFTYPKNGNELYKSIKENFSDITWAGFYLGRSYLGFTRAAYEYLIRIGFGVAPVYFGLQLTNAVFDAKNPKPVKDGYKLGEAEGRKAVAAAQAAGIPAGSYLFFDIEPTRVQIPAQWLLHFAGWSQTVLDANYGNGAYVTSGHAPVLLAGLRKVVDGLSLSSEVAAPRIWGVKYLMGNGNNHRAPKPTTPDSSLNHSPGEAYAKAELWQWGQNQWLQWTDKQSNKKLEFWPVDLNTSTYFDPGMDV
jgi:hypothetical protein